MARCLFSIPSSPDRSYCRMNCLKPSGQGAGPGRAGEGARKHPQLHHRFAPEVVIDLLFTSVFLGVMYYNCPLLSMVVLATITAYDSLSLLVTPVLRHRAGAKGGAALAGFPAGLDIGPQTRRYSQYPGGAVSQQQLGSLPELAGHIRFYDVTFRCGPKVGRFCGGVAGDTHQADSGHRWPLGFRQEHTCETDTATVRARQRQGTD